MNIVIILKKFWLYLGPFYLSLIFFLLISFFTKFKKKIIFLFLLVNLIFSFKLYFKNITDFLRDFKKFFVTQEKKMNLLSANQYSFLQEIEKLLPMDKIICYPWPTDIAGRYAQQFLYPRRVILSENDIKRCNLLVLDYSIKTEKYNLENQLDSNDKQIFSNDLGRVFQINR